jgi:hypothetical protein
MASSLGPLPRRIQRSRERGWRMPPGAVYVGRPSRWGNPYRVAQRPPLWPAERLWGAAEAVECYELMLASGWRLRRWPGFHLVEAAMRELEGRDLCCWCPPGDPCHGDVLLRYANAAVDFEGNVEGNVLAV